MFSDWAAVDWKSRKTSETESQEQHDDLHSACIISCLSKSRTIRA
jgi:hypothetical protein